MTMIERVARAISRKRWPTIDPDQYIVMIYGGPHPVSAPTNPYDPSRPAWVMCVDEARAAIEAMMSQPEVYAYRDACMKCDASLESSLHETSVRFLVDKFLLDALKEGEK